MNKKIITIIGARPQFIKAAMVSKALYLNPKIEEIVIHTGQHFDKNMSDVFFEQMNIKKPKYNLKIGGGTHGENTGRMIENIEKLLLLEKPDLVLVYGDTDSTLAGAIAASKLNIYLVHIEAGLRSFNRKMPEEINRILTDHASNLLFIPTMTAGTQLKHEGIEENNIIFSGDVMYDATLHFSEILDPISIGIRLNIEEKKLEEPFYLLTLHRAENVDNKEKVKEILEALGNVNSNIIWPIHPRSKARIEEFNLNIPNNIIQIDPVGYLDMLFLEKHSNVILTDSGGVQKEAYFQGKACITIRTETEWNELVSIGANFLVGEDIKNLEACLKKALSISKAKFKKDLYGKGDASQIIAASLSERLLIT